MKSEIKKKLVQQFNNQNVSDLMNKIDKINDLKEMKEMVDEMKEEVNNHSNETYYDNSDQQYKKNRSYVPLKNKFKLDTFNASF